MKKMSPFKYLYYTGLSVVILLSFLFLSVIYQILKVNHFFDPKVGVFNVVLTDTTYKKVVVYDTVPQRVLKPIKTTPNEVIVPVVNEVKEVSKPVLDTTK